MYWSSCLRGKVFGVFTLRMLKEEPFCVVGIWNGFLLAKAKKEGVPCQFCGEKKMEMVIFWECTLPHLLHVREVPEDRSRRPHGWLPGLSCGDERSPWAASFGQLACSGLERCLGAYPVDSSGCWTPPDYWDAHGIALEMSDHPVIWTDGSREDFSSIGDFEVAGAGVYLPAAEVAFESAVWGVAEEYGDARLERCRAFMPVPGVLQTVQRAEFWGAIVAMQAYWPCLGNLNVARSVGRLLDRDCLAEPLPLVLNGDLVSLAQCMIRTRGRETVRVTKVEGDATDADVEQGRRIS